uniref:Copia protein n=1 Tax=Tanacetum cinerariifolium TaxID=118510 RepID=A0A6L2KQN8_TANCI|nr:copia protein [Tanacetum cinerariifolium]
MIFTVDFKSKFQQPMGIEGIAKVSRGWFLGCDYSLDCKKGREDNEQCRDNVHWQERNKAHLANYQEFKGGFVAFGGSNGRIIGKGNIKAGSFNIKNIDPSRDLACLFAKASINESNKWHRRLGHVNFKNLNKLVKGNLVRGLPSKIFKNDHTYDACQKGKQHKASYSFLPTTFWAKAVNTACYALNRVLVTKPQNKTPYELLTGKQPIISYLGPFRCHVTILSTIDQLGKFDGKSNLGFLVGYSLNNKAFRVYNLETKRVEENLHVNFLKNKPNDAGKGHAWMFDLDYLTNSMNYEPVLVENQANKSAGLKEANNSTCTQANDDQSANSEEINLHEEHFVLPIWSAYSTTVKNSGDKIEKNTNFKTCKKPNANTSNTNLLNTVNTPLSTVGPLRAFNDGDLSYLDDPLMPQLEDIYANPSEGIFTDSSYDDEGVVTDFNNLETTVNVSPTPTTRIHTIHPKNQILEDLMSVVQTRSKLNKNYKAHALGHRQEKGIDYDEVFALVARIEAIRIFLAFAFYMGFIVYQMDVKSAFLYGTIDEKVYVSQPSGFVDPKFPNKAYKVVKALYCLHQAPRAWYATLSTFLEKSRYRRGAIDKTFFIKKDKKDIMLVQVYVDDIIFGSTKKSWCDKFEELMKNSVKTVSTLIETQKPLVKDEEAVDVDVHLYRDAYEKNLIQVLKIDTDDNVADLLTKAFDFWKIAIFKTINNISQIHAKVAGKPVVITEASIRSDLLFSDVNGINCLINEAIFENLALMGYEGDLAKLNFQKAIFSPQ